MPKASFLESHRAEHKRYRIAMRDCSHMGVAALWDYRHMEDGSNLVSCAMITCEPNDLVAKIHNRMPAIPHP